MSRHGASGATLAAAAEALAPLALRIPTKVFICGCGHSGTSIAARILATHPAAYVPQYETEAFLPEKFMPPAGVAAVEAARNLLQQAAASGRPAFVEKTPRHVYAVALIRRLVPGARFLMPVRDGRDVAASIAHRTGDLDRGLTRWVTETALVRAEIDQPDVLVYRYEDFIDDPQGMVQRWCAFADLEFTHELLDYHQAEQLWFRTDAVEQGDGRSPPEHRKLRNWQINQPLFDGRGRWQRELNAEQLKLFEQGAALELMQAFGYL